uniref:Uncharacterized protein n=1 Tax=viral metagenome TaxID=1070528 RepID=A0A6M3J4Y2_9ZZZZ
MNLLCLFKHNLVYYHRLGKMQAAIEIELNSGDTKTIKPRPMKMWRKCLRCGRRWLVK